MSNGIKLCRSCMNSVPSDAVNCPNCGYNGKQQNEINCLPIGYRLGGRYIVGMCKNRDGDSASYVGFDCTLNRPVEVREFLPTSGCMRDTETMNLVHNPGAELLYKTCLMDYCELYKNLRKIEGNPGIIRTSDFFEANSTAYAIIDVFDGISLREFLSMAGGTISCEQATKLLEPIFGAVEAIHAVNLIHRGISPDTIFVNRNGDVRLGGFATSQVRTKGTDVACKLYSGYTAPEQYATTMWQGTATDVYSLAAVYYRCITGAAPQDAEQRRSYDTLEQADRLKPGISQPLARTLSIAMLVNSQERTQYAIELLSAIKNPVMPRQINNQFAYAPAAPADSGDEYSDDYMGYDDEDEGYEDGRIARDRGRTKERDKKKKGGYPLWIERLGIRNFWIITIAVAAIVVGIGTMLLVKAIFVPTLPTKDVNEKAPETVVVPDYVGMNFSDAIALFDRENFNYDYEYVFEGKDDVDKIVRQMPEKGTKVEQGTKIVLIINMGYKVEVPNVVEMFIDDAGRVLTQKGIKYEVIYELSERPEGIVLKQSINMGAKIDPETQKVVLTVAVKPEAPKPPDPDPEVTDPPDDDGTGASMPLQGYGNGIAPVQKSIGFPPPRKESLKT